MTYREKIPFDQNLTRSLKHIECKSDIGVHVRKALKARNCKSEEVIQFQANVLTWT